MKIEARDSEVLYASNGEFEANHKLITYTVNINNITCSCKKWDMTSIPCVHGVASIVTHNGVISDYVHECYSINTWRRVYNHMIYPIPDKSLWVKTPYDELMPPPLRRAPGRPKKSRNKALDELTNSHQVKRFHQSLRYKNCGEIDHNIKHVKDL